MIRRLAPPETKSHVKELNDWTEEMLRLLSQFITLLSETTQAWEEFEKCDLGYFISDKNKERSPYRQKIQKSYSGLRLKLKSLQNLKVELIENNRHQVRCVICESRAPDDLGDVANHQFAR